MKAEDEAACEGQAIESHNHDQRMPRLVYGLVYKGSGALAWAQPNLRLSCKRRKNKRADERTRTAHSCSLRVRFHAFTAVSRRFRNRLRKSFLPVVRFWMSLDVRSGYCQ